MSAIQVPDGPGPGIILNNRHYGQSQTSGSILGKPPSLEFINPGIIPGNIDLYPLNGSSLRDSGTSVYGAPVDDFNLRNRPFNAIWDVGAYEWSQNTNPGWPIHEDFKDIDYGTEETKAAFDTGKRTRSSVSVDGYAFLHLPDGVRITIFNIAGMTVHQSGPIGKDFYRWHAANAAAGIYFYAIADRTGNIIEYGRILLIK
jgi:hypothetical protein